MVIENNRKKQIEPAIDLDRVDACYLLDLPVTSSQKEIIEVSFKSHYKKAFMEMQKVQDQMHRDALGVHIQALIDARNTLLGRAKTIKPLLNIPAIII